MLSCTLSCVLSCARMQILVTHLQVSSMVKGIPLQWPYFMTGFMDMLTQISSASPSSVVPVQCSLTSELIPKTFQAIVVVILSPGTHNLKEMLRGWWVWTNVTHMYVMHLWTVASVAYDKMVVAQAAQKQTSMHGNIQTKTYGHLGDAVVHAQLHICPTIS